MAEIYHETTLRYIVATGYDYEVQWTRGEQTWITPLTANEYTALSLPGASEPPGRPHAQARWLAREMPRFNTPGGKRAPGDVGETAQGDVQVLHTDGRRITYTTGEFTGNVADPVTLVTIEKAMTHLKDGKMRVRE